MSFCSFLGNCFCCSLFYLQMCFVEPPNKKSTKKEKKPTTFTCYDLLSKWFWWWAGIHSRLWIIYLHYWVSQWIHKIDVQMRDSKCDELLPHKGSQSLSASVQSERQWLQDCWEVSKHCFLLHSCNPFGEGKFILDSTPKCCPNWRRPSKSVCWDLLFEKVRQKSKPELETGEQMKSSYFSSSKECMHRIR